MNPQVIQHIDHVTYVGRHENEEQFLSQWKLFGFNEIQRLQTNQSPATHIALTAGAAAGFPWGTMTGLSISLDEQSPINEFIRRYGEGVQHAAYNIDPQADMEQIQIEMQKSGWQFMTSVLVYKDSHGAKLKQMFSAPSRPYGYFIEFVQRLNSPNGEVYGGFDTHNIEDLYESYADFSQWLEAHPHSTSSNLYVSKPTWKRTFPSFEVTRPF